MAKKQGTTVSVGLIALIVAMIVAGVYWYKNKKPNTGNSNNGGNANNGGGNTYVPQPNPTPKPKPLPILAKWSIQYGSRGDRVETLQKYLNWKQSAGLKVDGIWGSKTEAAVKASMLAEPVTDIVWNAMKKEYDDNNSWFGNPFGRTAETKKVVAPQAAPMSLIRTPAVQPIKFSDPSKFSQFDKPQLIRLRGFALS